MRLETFPARTGLSAHFPVTYPVLGGEGWGIDAAEQGGRYYLILDESTMAEFLEESDPGDGEVLKQMVKVFEFDSIAKREWHLPKCERAIRTPSC